MWGWVNFLVPRRVLWERTREGVSKSWLGRLGRAHAAIAASARARRPSHVKRSPDLPDLVDQLAHRLVLVADHVRVRFELPLRVHELRELQRRVDVGTFDELTAERAR